MYWANDCGIDRASDSRLPDTRRLWLSRRALPSSVADETEIHPRRVTIGRRLGRHHSVQWPTALLRLARTTERRKRWAIPPLGLRAHSPCEGDGEARVPNAPCALTALVRPVYVCTRRRPCHDPRASIGR